MFEATTVFNNIEYELELSESIELPSGKGDIFGTISYETEDGKENTYDFSLSFDVEKYDDANAEELQLSLIHIYILAIGSSDITDLITNTAGGLLGIALYSIVARLLKSREKADKLFLVIAVIVSTFIIGLLALLLFLN